MGSWTFIIAVFLIGIAQLNKMQYENTHYIFLIYQNWFLLNYMLVDETLIMLFIKLYRCCM